MNPVNFFEISEGIPKKVHQTYFRKNNLPLAIENNIKRICDLNPEWTYHLYDDSDIETQIIRYYGPEVLKIYHRINPEYGAARADFFRYLIVYAEGGVYLDIKSTLSKPLSQILRADDKFILSKWANKPGGKNANWGLHPELETFPGGEFQQWYIVSSRGHPYLRAIIEAVIRNIEHYNINIHGVGKEGVLRLTGPIAYTLAIECVKNDALSRYVENIEEAGIHSTFYENKYDHESLFRKHYAALNTPVVRINNLISFFHLSRYKIKKRLKVFKRTIRKRLKKSILGKKVLTSR